MRKSVVFGLSAVIAAGLFAVSALAFDLGGKVKDATKGAVGAASKAVVEKEINKDLRSKNCAFKAKSTELTCDLSDLLSTLKTKKAIAEESGFANDVDIHVEVGQGSDPKNPNLGYQRLDVIRNELKQKVSWWDWYDMSVSGDKLNVYVKIE